MNDVTEFFIPMNTPSSKNSKIWTGKFLVNSRYTQKWKRHTREEWIRLTPLFKKAVLELQVEPPYYIEFEFIRKTKAKFDYINMSQILCDTMVHYKWIEDDDTKGIKPYYADPRHDKVNHGVIIRLLKYKPQHYGHNQAYNTADS